jgi:hypothetical protein
MLKWTRNYAERRRRERVAHEAEVAALIDSGVVMQTTVSEKYASILSFEASRAFLTRAERDAYLNTDVGAFMRPLGDLYARGKPTGRGCYIARFTTALTPDLNEHGTYTYHPGKIASTRLFLRALSRSGEHHTIQNIGRTLSLEEFATLLQKVPTAN